MGHLLILLHIVTLFLGVWATFLARQADRAGGFRAAHALYVYLVCFNLMVFVVLAGRYAMTNMPMGSPSISRIIVHAGVMIGSLLTLVATAYWLLRSAYEARHAAFPKSVSRAILIGGILFGLNCLVSLAFWVWQGLRTWVAWNNAVMIPLAALFCGFGSLGLARNRDEEPPVRQLGLALMAGYSLIVIAAALSRDGQRAISAAAWLWLAGASLLWLRAHASNLASAAVAKRSDVDLDAFARQYSITPREREVMELLFQGRSYKEIEGQLCISLGTVKNHAYNLYRKVGVNSRAQLIHLAIQHGTLPPSSRSTTDHTR